MKLISYTFFVCLFITLQLSAQRYDPHKIAPNLVEKIENGSQENIPVFILLKDHLDVVEMTEQFRSNNISRQERAQQLIPALQQFADKDQIDIVQTIKRNSASYTPESFQQHWINNGISLFAKAELLGLLSLRDDVEFISLQGEIIAEEGESVEAPTEVLFPAPNNTEAGLRAIDAPELWRLGYTGYGTKALIIDSGGDATHPSLDVNYIGLYDTPNASYRHGGGDEVRDCGDHGTHVAGTILGLDRRTNDTIGVAFNANWMAASIFSGCSYGFNFVINSFEWAMNPDGDVNTTDDMPDVINNSWRWSENNQCTGMFQRTFNAVEAVGIAIVFSAGNEGPDSQTITSPKNVSNSLVNVFCVGALDGNRADFPITGFSSIGPGTCGVDGSLLIKPEVAAPGNRVRSAVPGGYGLKNGTSMAAPHAAGAVLLLKEAFPFLTGEEIKLALYFSAVDLGEPGEDNTFGMGIINVKNAYDYLIDQGHTPVVVERADNDALIFNIEGESTFCESVNSELLIEFENAAAKDLNQMDINFYLDGDKTNPIETIQWTGNLKPGQRDEIIWNLKELEVGEHQLLVELVNPNGVVDERGLNNRLTKNIEIYDENKLSALPLGDFGEPCEGKQVILRSSFEGEGEISWYENTIRKEQVGSGPLFTTPVIDQPTSYLQEVIVSEKTGLENFDAGTTEINDEINTGVGFVAFRPFTINSVKIYAEDTDLLVIQLVNGEGEVLDIKNQRIRTAGEQRIEVNFDVDEGPHAIVLGRALKLQSTVTNTGYPYTINNVLAIGAGINEFFQNDEYYYFYDWDVSYEYVCGEGEFTVNPVETDDPSTAGFEVSDTADLRVGEAVIFTDLSSNGTVWHWDFGDGNVSTETSTSHIYQDTGWYTIVQVVTNAQDCSDALSKVIRVNEAPTSASDLENQYSSQIQIFPNPTKQQLTISMDFESVISVNVELVDILGKSIKQLTQTETNREQLTIDLSGISSGIYYLRFNFESGEVVSKKVVKI